MPVYQQINEKMLEVKLSNEEVFARKGAMVSYQGEVQFSRSFLAGQGVQSLAMRAVTNEGYAMMAAKGSGSVYYAHAGLFVTIIPVRGETLYVESDTLLAFDARLTAGTMFLGNQGGIQGVVRGAVSGQGLFTTTLQGTGEVAILSDGNAIGLPVTHGRAGVCRPASVYRPYGATEFQYRHRPELENLCRPSLGRIVPGEIHGPGHGLYPSERKVSHDDLQSLHLAEKR